VAGECWLPGIPAYLSEATAQLSATGVASFSVNGVCMMVLLTMLRSLTPVRPRTVVRKTNLKKQNQNNNKNKPTTKKEQRCLFVDARPEHLGREMTWTLGRHDGH